MRRETHHHCDENRTRKVPFRESAALVARIGSNLRSQFGILANADANRRECRANWRHYYYLCNINDLPAVDAVCREPLCVETCYSAKCSQLGSERWRRHGILQRLCAHGAVG